eukprot:bmy_15486T0
MEVENQTRVTRFILVAFPGNRGVRATVFLTYLVACILTVAENVIIILLVQQNRPLHKPVYFFLDSLSFSETWYLSVPVPKVLFSFRSVSSGVSFTHCMTQLYFFIALLCTECVLLAAVACDRYVAICRPLRYPTIMSHGLCFLLPLGSWTNGFGISLAKIYFISCLSFCGPNAINHFFCDISLSMHKGCGLFDIKKSKASNSEAKLLDQNNFFNLAFCSEGCHGNEHPCMIYLCVVSNNHHIVVFRGFSMRRETGKQGKKRREGSSADKVSKTLRSNGGRKEVPEAASREYESAAEKEGLTKFKDTTKLRSHC